MDHIDSKICIAFEGARRIASGSLAEVVAATKPSVDRGAGAPILIFDQVTSAPIEVDFRGTLAEVLARLPTPEPISTIVDKDAPRGPGRPKLGVVAREVTLLPRHWDWLSKQPSGASVALRKLVEAARRSNEGPDQTRRARDAAYKFISVLAGNEPGFEEASRALFAGNRTGFAKLAAAWPADVRDHALTLAAKAFP